MNNFKSSQKQETECASQPTIEESQSPEFRTRKTTLHRLSGKDKLAEQIGESRPDSPTIDNSPTRVRAKKPRRRCQGTAAARVQTNTDGSSPMQSSMKAKTNLHNQAFDTSTEEKAALFNDMKIMAQMGQQMNPSQMNRSDDGSSMKADQVAFGASGGGDGEPPGMNR